MVGKHYFESLGDTLEAARLKTTDFNVCDRRINRVEIDQTRVPKLSIDILTKVSETMHDFN